MALSVLPDRSRERREGRGGERGVTEGGPVQERGEFFSKTQSFLGLDEPGSRECLGL